MGTHGLALLGTLLLACLLWSNLPLSSLPQHDVLDDVIPVLPALQQRSSALHHESSMETASAPALKAVRAKFGMCATHCHECYVGISVRLSCKVCKHKYYLLDGACLRACPSGHQAVGQGAFDRKCIPTSLPANLASAHRESAGREHREGDLTPDRKQHRARRAAASDTGAATSSTRAPRTSSKSLAGARRAASKAAGGDAALLGQHRRQQRVPCRQAHCTQCRAAECQACQRSFALRNGTCHAVHNLTGLRALTDSLPRAPLPRTPPPARDPLWAGPVRAAARPQHAEVAIVSLSPLGTYLWRAVLGQPVYTTQGGLFTGKALFGKSMVSYLSGDIEPSMAVAIRASTVILAVDLTEENSEAEDVLGAWLAELAGRPGIRIGLVLAADACSPDLSALSAFSSAVSFVLHARTTPPALAPFRNVKPWPAGGLDHEIAPPRTYGIEDWAGIAREHFCHVLGPLNSQSQLAAALALSNGDRRCVESVDETNDAALWGSDYAIIAADSPLTYERRVFQALEAGAIPVLVGTQRFGCDGLLAALADAPFLWVPDWAGLHIALARAPSSRTQLDDMAATRARLRAWLQAHKDNLQLTFLDTLAS
eukprot:m.79784 g.79784  ORF g.79784 m.79784 type:complete len:599 (-) comp8013_c0_seq2:118-1914(-)